MTKSARPKKTDIFTGIDIGSANIRCAILDYNSTDNKNSILGIGSSQSTGIKSGNIVSRDKLVEDIEKALTEAEKMAKKKVEVVWLSVSGEHIRGINTQGAIAIDVGKSENGESSKIDENDVSKVLDLAKGISFPADREILHVLPQEYVVDVMEKIKEPVGISGRRLEARPSRYAGRSRC